MSFCKKVTVKKGHGNFFVKESANYRQCLDSVKLIAEINLDGWGGCVGGWVGSKKSED